MGMILVVAGLAAFHFLGSQPETPPLWKNGVSAKIFSDPISVGENYIFLGGDKGRKIFKLFAINRQGELAAESPTLSSFPFPPIVTGDTIILGDSARMIRGFSLPDLKIKWESGTMEQFKLPPTKVSEDRFLIQSTKHVLFCLDSQTGKPVWERSFVDTLVNFAVGKVIVCLHGYTDLKVPQWKATAISPETGETVWTLTLPLSHDTPLFVQNICVLSSNEGEIIIVNQNDGSVLHKNTVKGLKAVQILDQTLVMLAAGGSRVVCMSLMTGSSWSTTLQSGFNGAAKYGERILLTDKKSLRCLDVDTGAQFWRRDLANVYNAFPHRRGIFVTHKDSFFSRETYGSYIETGTGQSTWQAMGRSLFMQPLITNEGDFVISYDGQYRMLPKPAGDNSTYLDSSDTNGGKHLQMWHQNGESGEKETKADD